MAYSRHNLARRNSGFTLIELILALFMAAILIVPLVTALKQAYNLKTASDRALEPSRTAEIAMELLRSDFQCAVPPSASALTTTYAYSISSLGTGSNDMSDMTASGTSSGTTSGSTSSTTSGNLSGPFEGGPSDSLEIGGEVDEIDFFTTADSPQDLGANSEIKEVRYDVVPEENVITGGTDSALVRFTTRDLLDAGGDPMDDATPDEEVICRGVVGFYCEYFDGQYWDDTWDSTMTNNELPAAVMVTISLYRPTPQDPGQIKTFTRVFTLSCSGATFDSSVNPYYGGSGNGNNLGGL